jgi:hypothetical protein
MVRQSDQCGRSSRSEMQTRDSRHDLDVALYCSLASSEKGRTNFGFCTSCLAERPSMETGEEEESQMVDR